MPSGSFITYIKIINNFKDVIKLNKVMYVCLRNIDTFETVGIIKVQLQKIQQ